MRLTDQIIAMEKIVCYSSQEVEECHTLEGHIEKHYGQSGDRRSKGKAWSRDFIAVHEKGKAR